MNKLGAAHQGREFAPWKLLCIGSLGFPFAQQIISQRRPIHENKQHGRYPWRATNDRGSFLLLWSRLLRLSGGGGGGRRRDGAVAVEEGNN